MIRYEFVGVDGSLWVFGSPLCPIRLAATPTGLGGAPFKHQRVANARQAGADWVGRDDEINVIGLKLTIGPMRAGKPAREVFTRWRNALGYGDEVGEFHVYCDGEHFWQYVRYEEPAKDPKIDLLDDIGWMQEEIKLSSDLSWWRAPDFEETYDQATFFEARIRNDGDVDSWPRYDITGPGVFVIGQADDFVTLPAIGVGQKWDINTDPEDAYIRDGNGVDKWKSVGIQRWRKAFKRKSVTPIMISSGGTTSASSVKVTLPQLYRRGTG